MIQDRKSINKLLNTHVGTQPIRVLQDYIPDKFVNTNPDFILLLEDAVKKLELQPNFEYTINQDLIKTPYLDSHTKKIHLHETFLSFVWCISYSLLTLYDRSIFYPKNSNQDAINSATQEISKAINLFHYGISLINEFTEWDKCELPNPEIYSKSEELLVKRANSGFIVAINWILCHEFAHVEMNHDASTMKTELDADRRATELMQFGQPYINSETTNTGILIGLCCLIFLNYEIKPKENTHPHADRRLNIFLENNIPEPSSTLWGIAYTALNLWDLKFEKWYSDINQFSSFKDLYYNIYKQIQDERLTLQKTFPD